jgi:hypothetical protein
MAEENNTRNALEEILRIVVNKPILETEERNKDAVDKLVWVHNLWIDTVKVPEKDDLSDLTYLWMTALQKELMWAIISTLSCSYASSLMTIRGIFEMLVKSTTSKKGKMNEMLKNIEFLADDERESLNEIWRGLSGWTHPYEKWFKEIDGDILMSFREYDRNMCEECVNYLSKVCDLMMVIALEKEFCKPKKVSKGIKALGLELSMRRCDK